MYGVHMGANGQRSKSEGHLSSVGIMITTSVMCRTFSVLNGQGSKGQRSKGQKSWSSSYATRIQLGAATWRCNIVVRTLISAGELSLSCAKLLAGWVTTLRLNRPLSVSQHGHLSHPSSGFGK